MNEANVTLLNAGSLSTLDQEQQPATVLENAAIAILIFDSEGHLSFANPAGQRLFADCEAKLGQRHATGSRYDSFLQLLDQARHYSTSFSGEVEWPDNRVFSATFTPVQDGGCVVTLNDMTRFERLERVKDEFIASASHDLRNMITAINGFSQCIQRIGPTNEAQYDFIQRIQHATTNMQETVEIMLNHAKLGLGVQEGFEELNVSQLVWQLADEFQPQVEAKQQLLAIEKTEPDLKVHGDPLQLRQALRNLIRHAIKSTSDGGTITLSIYKESNLVYITIKDTSYGVPAADLPHIFDHFYRVRNNGHEDLESDDFGLAIVKTIVEEHRGIVTIESEPGKGSCFTLKLPLARVEGVDQ